MFKVPLLLLTCVISLGAPAAVNFDTTSRVMRPTNLLHYVIASDTVTPRSIQDRILDHGINPIDLGAVSDDGLDDYDALKAAEALAIELNKPIFLGANVYHISETWEITNRVVIIGQGIDAYNATNANTRIIKLGDFVGMKLMADNIYAEGFNLRGNYNIDGAFSETTDGIWVGDSNYVASGVTLRNISATFNGGNGIWVQNGNSGTYEVNGSINKGIGFLLKSTHPTVDNANINQGWLRAIGNGDTGVKIENSTVNMFRINSEGNSTNDIRINSPHNILHVYAENGQVAELSFGPSGYNNIVSGKYVHSRLSADDTTWSNNDLILWNNTNILRRFNSQLIITNQNLTLGSSGVINWGQNGIAGDGSPNVGLARDGFNRLKVTDGSTDYGDIIARGFHNRVESSTVVGGLYQLAFNSEQVKLLTLQGNVSFSSASLAAGRRLEVVLLGAATNCTLTFPGDWNWQGDEVTTVKSNTVVVFKVLSTTTADSGVYIQALDTNMYAKISHVHDATDITTGNFDADVIAGGTATSGYVPISNGDGTVTWGPKLATTDIDDSSELQTIVTNSLGTNGFLIFISGTPLDGQIPKYNSDGTITWENDTAGSSSVGDDVYVNEADISNANFSDSATIIWIASDTNLFAYVTNINNAQIAAGAAIDVSKLSGVVALAGAQTISGSKTFSAFNYFTGGQVAIGTNGMATPNERLLISHSTGIILRAERSGRDTFEIQHTAGLPGFSIVNVTDTNRVIGFTESNDIRATNITASRVLTTDGDSDIVATTVSKSDFETYFTPDSGLVTVSSNQTISGTKTFSAALTPFTQKVAIGTNAVGGSEQLMLAHSGVIQRWARSDGSREAFEWHNNSTIVGLGLYNVNDGTYPLIAKEDGRLVINEGGTTFQTTNQNTTGTIFAHNGVFTNGLTLNGTTVSVEGHTHADYVTLTTDQTISGNKTYTGAMIQTADTIAATEIDWSAGNQFNKSISGNTTFTFANATAGQWITVQITATGSYTVTWPTVTWQGGVAPTQTASKTDFYTFYYNGTTYYGSASQNY